ncbi:Cilia- and flagella-associated protein 57, partial [Physocladia obscura]
MQFSDDARYLLAQLGSPDWILHYYMWEKGKLLAAKSINCPKHTNDPKKSFVIEVGICPDDGYQLSILGDTFFRLKKYADGAITAVGKDFLAQDGTAFQCHSWLSMDKVALGTSNSCVIITNGVSTFQKINLDASVLNFGVRVLRATSKGFIAAGQSAKIEVFEKRVDAFANSEMYVSVSNVSVMDESVAVRTLAVSGTESSMIVQTETNTMFKVNLGQLTLNPLDVKMEPILAPYHHGSVIGFDLCTRKPLLASCSTDRSVRIWNYMTGELELCKYFPEEAMSIAIHPSGLYLIIGFGDKLRVMNILIDDFRLFKEVSIRACREVCFSNGGHFFAAVYGNMIQLYNFWTFENISILKGHNGKVRSLYWTPNDEIIVSAGSDGAVYSWNVKDAKRDGEYILKNCSYSSAVSSNDGKYLYAVGSDRFLREITESSVSCQVESSDMLTQIAISNSGRMFFAGTSRGCIRSIKFPLTSEPEDYQQHQVHSATVTKLRVSVDDTHLFSASEDGTIYMFKLTDRNDPRGATTKKSAVFSDEILITKSDLEEKTVLMNELQRSLDELKLEHEYQLRLKDMNFNEKLKDLNEKFSQEIETLKISSNVLRAEKEKEDAKHEDELTALQAQNMNELHERESKYNQELMTEYEKYQSLQGKSQSHQDQWRKQMKDFDMNTQRALAFVQKEYEEKISLKQADIKKLIDQINTQVAECEEIARQNNDDIDSEITLLQGRYEKKMRVERDECARLKGENGIMRKKFNTLTKDIEDNKAEILRTKEDEKRLKSVIAMLEKEIIAFKKEMAERDELIQDKERRVYELKKKNQELEKFKFVLDFRIKELKEQVEPRETEISVMSDQIN